MALKIVAEEGLPKDVKTEIVWNSYTATAYAEGFGEGEDGTPEQKLQAWAWLIKNGVVWSLQGFFGRTATQLIDAGIISEKGEIMNAEAGEEFVGRY